MTTRRAAIRFIDPPEPDERIVAIELEGHFTAEDMQAFVDRIEALRAKGKKARVYQDMRAYEGVDVGAVTLKLKNMGILWKGIEKVAVVGDSRWLAIYIDVVDTLTPQQIRHFEGSEKEEAFAWLAE